MRSLIRLREVIRPYRLQVILLLLAVLAATATSLVMPAILQRVIDVGLAGGQVRYLALASLAILLIGAARSSLLYVQRYLGEWTATHVGYDYRNRLYDHIQHLSFSFHDRSQTGQLISRCIEDVRAIERFTGFGVVEMIRLGLLMVGIVTILFAKQPNLALIALLPMIPLVLITTNFGQRVGKYFLHVDNMLGELSSRVQ